MFFTVLPIDKPALLTTVVSVLIISLGAMTLLHAKPYVFALFAAVAYGLSLFVTKDALLSADMFWFVPAAIALAVLMARGADRVTAIWGTAVFCVAALIVPLALALRAEHGSLSHETLSAFFDELRALFLEAWHLAIEQNGSALSAEVLARMTDDVFHAAFDSVIVLLPALFSIIGCVIAFTAHLLTLALCRSSGYAKTMPPRAQVFIMSKTSAVIFIVTMLLLLLGLGSSDTGVTVTIAATNVMLMLFPAFLVVGILGVVALVRRMRGCLNVWVLLALVFILPYFIAALITPLALFGVFLILGRPRLKE